MKCLFADNTHAHAILSCSFQGHVGAAGKEGKQGMKGAKVSSKNSDLAEESLFDLFCYWCLALASVSWLCRGQVEPRDQWGRQAQWDPKDGQEGLVQKGFEAFRVQRYVYGCKIVFLFLRWHNIGKLKLTLNTIHIDIFCDFFAGWTRIKWTTRADWTTRTNSRILICG